MAASGIEIDEDGLFLLLQFAGSFVDRDPGDGGGGDGGGRQGLPGAGEDDQDCGGEANG